MSRIKTASLRKMPNYRSTWSSTTVQKKCKICEARESEQRKTCTLISVHPGKDRFWILVPNFVSSSDFVSNDFIFFLSLERNISKIGLSEPSAEPCRNSSLGNDFPFIITFWDWSFNKLLIHLICVMLILCCSSLLTKMMCSTKSIVPYGGLSILYQYY